MNTKIYMATSLDNFIARKNDDTDFLSEAGWDNFTKIVTAARCLIIGRRTYEIMLNDGNFDSFDDAIALVVVSKTLKEADHKVVSSPQEALDHLSSKGFDTALVCGGSKLNASFLAAGLVNELQLDIEPVILGQGIPLFAETDLDTTALELIKTDKLPNDTTLSVLYKVA